MSEDQNKDKQLTDEGAEGLLPEKETKEEKQEVDLSYLSSFEQEMVTIFSKSQDSFEKQLSFISSGALVLSVGFMKDIIPNAISESKCKTLLGIGWILLIATLLLNLISHMVAARYANKTISEIRKKKYKRKRIINRNKRIIKINWASIGTMIAGIILITTYIIKNLIG